jgi:propanediol dehydratase small subunit
VGASSKSNAYLCGAYNKLRILSSSKENAITTKEEIEQTREFNAELIQNYVHFFRSFVFRDRKMCARRGSGLGASLRF